VQKSFEKNKNKIYGKNLNGKSINQQLMAGALSVVSIKKMYMDIIAADSCGAKRMYMFTYILLTI
jgi:hypothetical protein